MFPYHVFVLRSPDGLIRFTSEFVEDGVLRTIARPVENENEKVIYAYRFLDREFTEEQSKKWMEDHEIEFVRFSPYIKSNGTWDGNAAKESLFEWGVCPKDENKLSKKLLGEFFLKVDGKGNAREDYSYPVAKVVDGKPEYDRDGLVAAFVAARGAHTGEVDNEVVKKALEIFRREFGVEDMSEGMKEIEQKQNRTIFREKESGEFKVFDETSWDDARAKKSLLEWATDDGKIQKKLLMKWFLDVDGGTGQNPLDYRYPVGNVVGGKPVYDQVGINHSWELASGRKTGIVNRMVQRKIIFLKRREKLPLTDEQLEFISRHMTSGDFKQNGSLELLKKYKNELRESSIYKSGDNFYVSVNNDAVKLNVSSEQDAYDLSYEFVRSGNFDQEMIKLNESPKWNEEYPGEIDLVMSNGMKLNAVAHYGKVIVETPEYIDIPVIPMREGVFVGTDGIPTLKKFEEFSKDAHWLEGQPILEGHTRPDEIVTYRHNRIGKLLDVKVRPDTRDVSAIARYFKGKLSPDKLDKIKSGNPYDGSIAYTCETSPESGEWNGEKYNAIEKTGYHFYHFAEVPEGACSVVNGCGFNLNSKFNDDSDNIVNGDTVSIKKNECASKKKKEEEIEAEMTEEEVTVLDEDGNECLESELVDGKCPVAEEKQNKKGETVKAEDTEEDVLVVDEAGNECAEQDLVDGMCPGGESEEPEEVKENARSISVDVRIPDEFTVKMNSILTENDEMRGIIKELSQKIDKIAAKMNESINVAEVKENSTVEETEDFEAFESKLNAAAKPDAKQHYAGFQKEGFVYLQKNDIFKDTATSQKLMGVATRGSIDDDLAAEKARLRKTLGRKH